MQVASFSCFRLLSDADNIARTGVLSASNTLPSSDVRIVGAEGEGGGELVLSGEYEGAVGADIEVEVLDTVSGAVSASRPVTIGEGDGTAEVIALYAGPPLQQIQLTLVDAGTDSIPARYSVGGAILRATVAGVGGNAMSLLVTRSLVFSPLPLSTVGDVSAGTTRLTGGGWDWGQPASDDGAVPQGALRFRFEGFPQIHRAWKEWDSGAWAYRIDPAPEWTIPSDVPLLSVAGGYDVELSDGVTTENYSVVTLWDFLSQIDARSTLARAETAITRDRRPGGMAVTDLPLITDAHALPVAASSATGRTLGAVEVSEDAPTEHIRVRSLGRLLGGLEQFRVSGSVTGPMPNAVSGERYNGGVVRFDTPEPLEFVRAGRITGKYIAAGSGDRTSPPSVCINPAILGQNATDKTVVFTYEKKPVAAGASCSPMRLDLSNIGLLDDGEGGIMAALHPDHKQRLKDLHQWLAGYQLGNVGFFSSRSRTYLGADTVESQIANACAATFSDALAEVYEEADALTEWDTAFDELKAQLAPYAGSNFAALTTGGAILATGWTAESEVAFGDYIAPTARNGNVYLVSISGTTGTTQPNWSLYTESPVIDGSVQYEIVNYWNASEARSVGSTLEPGNGRRYVSSGGTTGATEPFWSLTAATVADGTITWTAEEIGTGRVETAGEFQIVERWIPYRPSGSGNPTGEPGDYELGVTRYVSATASLFSGGIYTGLFGSSGLIYISDNVSYEQALEAARSRARAILELHRTVLAAAADSIEPIVSAWKARMNYCRAIAGLIPKSAASIEISGGRCWRENITATHWWAAQSDEYLPAFSDTPYYSAIAKDGQAICTKEFAFGFRVNDQWSLREGDQIVITITGTASGGVRDGDEWTIPIIGGGAKLFTGGEDGDPTQRWACTGSAVGQYPDYLLDPSAPLPYTAGPGEITITPGSVPFAPGDAIRFASEAGEGQWRRRLDGDIWSAWEPFDLYAGPVDTGDGVTVETRQGIAPSFAAGDSWSIRAEATFGAFRMAASNLDSRCQWGAGGSVIDIDAGAAQKIDGLLIGFHTIPQGAVVTIKAALVPISTALPEEITELSLTWIREAAWVPAGITARYIEITIDQAASIGWLWAGAGWQPTVSPSGVAISRAYHPQRGSGLNAGGVSMGAAWDLDIEWREDAVLSGASLDDLLERIDSSAEDNFSPLAVVTSVGTANRAYIGILDDDAVEVRDLWEHSQSDRLATVALRFKGAA